MMRLLKLYQILGLLSLFLISWDVLAVADCNPSSFRNLSTFSPTRKGVSYTFAGPSLTGGFVYVMTLSHTVTHAPQSAGAQFTSASLRTKSGLYSGFSYTMKIVIKRNNGSSNCPGNTTGGAGLTSTFTTIEAVPNSPIRNLRVESTDGSQNKITLKWRSPTAGNMGSADGIDEYHVCQHSGNLCRNHPARPAGSCYGTRIATISLSPPQSADPTITHTKAVVLPDTGGEYCFSVMPYRSDVVDDPVTQFDESTGYPANNHVGRDSEVEYTISGPPTGQPDIDYFLPRYSNSYTLRTNMPESEMNFSPVTSYNFRFKRIDQQGWSGFSMGANVRHYSISGIKDYINAGGDTFFMQTQAVNPKGASDWSTYDPPSQELVFDAAGVDANSDGDFTDANEYDFRK